MAQQNIMFGGRDYDLEVGWACAFLLRSVLHRDRSVASDAP